MVSYVIARISAPCRNRSSDEEASGLTDRKAGRQSPEAKLAVHRETARQPVLRSPGNRAPPVRRNSSGVIRAIRSLAATTCRAPRASTTARSSLMAMVLPACFAWSCERDSPHLHSGWSEDGLTWHIEPKPIVFSAGGGRVAGIREDYAYDPRVCKIDDTYFITWCGGHNGPTISVASTHDFQSFTRLENAFLPFNRNGVLFPRQIEGKY